MRVPSESYRKSQAALEVVGPTRERLAGWAKQCAYIVSIARLGRGDTAAVVAQATVLLDAIAGERRALETRVENQPEDIRNHGRVSDALRSLDALSATLKEAVALLNS
jgi:hypothetical protein